MFVGSFLWGNIILGLGELLILLCKICLGGGGGGGAVPKVITSRIMAADKCIISPWPTMLSRHLRTLFGVPFEQESKC